MYGEEDESSSYEEQDSFNESSFIERRELCDVAKVQAEIKY